MALSLLSSGDIFMKFERLDETLRSHRMENSQDGRDPASHSLPGWPPSSLLAYLG